MKRDKKAEQDKLVFIMLKQIGEAIIDRTINETKIVRY
jgi:3-dehydroquinate synthetase